MYFKELEYNGRIFVYDFSLLNAEQAELAREAGEFKFNQSQIEPENFQQVLRSKGADYLFIICSFIFIEKVNDKLIEFDRDTAVHSTELLLKKLPASYIKDLREAVTDFFTSTGQEKMILSILQSVKKRSVIETLLPIILQNQMQKKENES